MTETVLAAIISVIVVSLISLVSLFFIAFNKTTSDKMLFYLVSFATGAMLGDVFIHIFPEMASKGLFNFQSSMYILASIVGFFILEQYLHWHHHHSTKEDIDHPIKPVVFLNLFGDGIHNFIDGLIIGGAYLLDFRLGIATTIAVALHEIPQEFGDYAILIYGGLSKSKALWLNFLTALTAVLGTVIVLILGSHDQFLPLLLSLAAGSLLYIALADLIPQLHNDQKKSLKQLLAFLGGILIMYLLLFLG